MTRHTDERREYYRIEDCLALEILPAEAPADASSRLFQLLHELHQLDVEAQPLLRQLGDRDRVLAHYLKLQNKRIELVSQAVAQELLKDFGSPRRVVLSEGGVNFPHDQPLAVGARITLKLLLLPEALGLQLQAQVLHCHREPDGRFDIGTEFVAPSDAQRQLLARHILQKQAAERRLAREAEQQGS